MAQGADLAPRWPGFAGGRAKREGSRSESYRVSLRNPRDNKLYEHEVAAGECARFTAGAKGAAVVNGFDRIVMLTPPARGAHE